MTDHYSTPLDEALDTLADLRDAYDTAAGQARSAEYLMDQIGDLVGAHAEGLADRVVAQWFADRTAPDAYWLAAIDPAPHPNLALMIVDACDRRGLALAEADLDAPDLSVDLAAARDLLVQHIDPFLDAAEAALKEAAVDE